ncbi:hypothetical protein ACRALDRAFT_1060773 [Sodiomyces alcalophilus JCM 7366]|uniref:uncharacterized protein n=1 Tax=Sodiomyces alcalophilus JCM 7366 TaxID=591952 RepID=UPI0039B4F5C3
MTTYEPLNIGSLTTTFVPPERCTDRNDIYNIYSTVGEGVGPYQLQGPIDIRNCYPPGYDPIRGAYFSPGICPEGFTVACSKLVSVGALTETIHTCCPTGNRHVCISEPIRKLHSTLICMSPLIGAGNSWTIDPITQLWGDETKVTSISGSIGGAAVNAYGIEVRFQSTDFVSTTESSVASSAESSSVIANSNSAQSRTTIGSSQPAETAQPSPSAATPSETGSVENSGGDGLGTGAIAGIAVGSAMGGLLIGALLLWLWIRRRRQRVAGAAQPDTWRPGKDKSHETKPKPHELPVVNPQELATDDGSNHWRAMKPSPAYDPTPASYHSPAPTAQPGTSPPPLELEGSGVR